MVSTVRIMSQAALALGTAALLAGCGADIAHQAAAPPARTATQAPQTSPVMATFTVSGHPNAVQNISAAVLQNVRTGNTALFNQQSFTYSKLERGLVAVHTELVPGHYELGLFGPNTAYRFRVNISRAVQAYAVTLPSQRLPVQATPLAGHVLENGRGDAHALLLALPIAANGVKSAQTLATAHGSYQLTLPGQGVYTILAVNPGKSRVAAAAADTLAGRPRGLPLLVRSLPGGRGFYAALLQTGLAYTPRSSLTLWGYSPAPGAVTMQIQALPGDGPPIFQQSLRVRDGLFHWSGNPWPKNFADLTATIILRAPSGRILWTATTPGIPETLGPSGAQSAALKTLIWGSIAPNSRRTVSFTTGSSQGLQVTPWSYGGMAMPTVHGLVPLPLASPTPWSTNPMLSARQADAHLLTPLSESLYVQSVSHFHAPLNSYMNGLSLSAASGASP